MLRNSAFLFFLSAGFLLSLSAYSQKADPEPKKNGIMNSKVSKRVKGWVSHNPGDTAMDKKSESVYKQYQGKIIRKITIHHIGFERNINDTTRSKIVNTSARVANAL